MHSIWRPICSSLLLSHHYSADFLIYQCGSHEVDELADDRLLHELLDGLLTLLLEDGLLHELLDLLLLELLELLVLGELELELLVLTELELELLVLGELLELLEDSSSGGGVAGSGATSGPGASTRALRGPIRVYVPESLTDTADPV